MDGLPLWLIWLIAGLVLALLELVAPGMVLIFFSLGCLLSALAALIYSDALVLQVTVFCISSVGTLLILRRTFMGWFQGQVSDVVDDGYDNSPEGALAEVSKDFGSDGFGQIKYRGSFWKAVAQLDHNFVVGDKVRIVSWADKSKTSFLVEKL
ncbi:MULTISPECIES: NfeD family protein [unclassified Maridesulfovibrio]|uniref:NfeD family protein n=1 Tax=unclassified Maridesulfovibrio TaxID=2794999 RepID=UPI003B3F950E